MWGKLFRIILLNGIGFGMFMILFEVEAAPRTYQRPSNNKSEAPIPQAPKLRGEQKLSYFKRQISKMPPAEMSPAQKKIFIELLDTLNSVPRGKWIIENAPSDLKFNINQKRTSLGASYGGTKWGLTISGEYFRKIQSASPEEKEQCTRDAVCTLAHEMTHAIQETTGLIKRCFNSIQEDFTINKAMELHALTEEATISHQLYDGKEKSFFALLKNGKISEGLSGHEAEKYARTQFVRKHWENTPLTPLIVNNEKIFLSQESAEIWGSSYNRICYKNLIEIPKKRTSPDFPLIIKKYVEIMDIDVEPDFFTSSKTTAFRVENNRFIGYMDGIKSQELQQLEAGVFEKGYLNGDLYLARNIFPKRKASDGSQKYVFDGGYATYVVQNGKMNGPYKEYDSNGEQVFEIPMEDNLANGDGWQKKADGIKVSISFKRGASNAYKTGKIRFSNKIREEK